MLDAIIILLACSSEAPKQCVPFFMHRIQIESPEACAQPATDIAETFATKAPADTIIRAMCIEDPDPPHRPSA